MSGPAPIWRETKMRLWQEKPALTFIEGEPKIVTWGRRQIPVEQLNDAGRSMMGIYVTAEMPAVREVELEEAVK
ncbi:hypothetical protein HYV64_00140 [Candidatus Shapirobacteria bacterium]|nr:hypothetical protein [Candidatus Shapirobacteria bacterium]